MSYYKSPDNSLHFIAPEFAHLLPTGSMPITAKEAEALRPKPHPLTYKEMRAAEYPPITDLLDGIVKGDEVQIQAYKDACLAIKVKYTK